ncbi:hypothetical protein NHX12_031592 [Muraenolepis orangiensis]|uniref:Hpc2-related domain-containing protein n=1 Tax=Muraenolepis orangiensis TaxID=630683 RepID=A0A9Q0IHG2_9TELE|nr:hypothetical protein NHX12_031592 [Muraenolepis orangiensis]
MKAEVRRALLLPFPCDSSSTPTIEKSTLPTHPTPSATASVAFPEAEGKRSKPDRSESTVRCVIKLLESGEYTFPEFSYTQLVEDQRGSSIGTKDGAHQNQSEDQLATIGRQFEKKHTKKDRFQDLVDIGYGYDDDDSFIDNSEAYDELVPASLSTEYGGFYVNSGVLKFRQASDSEAEVFTPKPPKDPFQKLKDAIGKVMPEQIARFLDNQQAHARVKFTMVTEEEKTQQQRVNVGSEGDEKVRKRGPQKKFKWNQEIRSKQKRHGYHSLPVDLT